MADQPPQPHQSLYRRYRPQRFDEVRGQAHVALALRNAVRDGQVGHAYLFSGPRGTGKTSTARILAKALNCSSPIDGEPCGSCPSCVEVARGSSLDVHELDAASNNGVDAMRELVSRAALGTPGRWKVYIIDEVHMLSAPASNAMLKTLEEPPGHVVFVLATTDPHKVLPTVRSRTQHFEFHLLSGQVLAELLGHVRADAGLEVAPGALDLAVRRGNGSARDALSALDQMVAAGTAGTAALDDSGGVVDEVVEALCERDTGRALVALGEGTGAGRDPQRLAVELLEHLRQGFLATLAPALVCLPEAGRTRAADQARRLGRPGLVRAMEVLGQAQVDMREALDARIGLEVALVRLTSPEADVSPAALLERVERLERRLAELEAAQPGQAGPASATSSRHTVPPRPPDGAAAPSGAARAALGALRHPRAQAAPDASTVGKTSPARAGPAGGQPAGDPAASTSMAQGQGPAQVDGAQGRRPPSRDDLVKAWGDHVLAGLKGRARALYRAGRFVSADGATAVFALPDEMHRSYCEVCREEVEAALGTHFGLPLALRLVVEGDEGHSPGAGGALDQEAAGPGQEAPVVSPAEHRPGTSDGPAGLVSVQDRLLRAFPGAEEL